MRGRWRGGALGVQEPGLEFQVGLLGRGVAGIPVQNGLVGMEALLVMAGGFVKVGQAELYLQIVGKDLGPIFQGLDGPGGVVLV